MGDFFYMDSGSDRIHSYLARPEKSNGAGLVLGSAVWGLNFDLIDFAECYASLGYTVLAPNLFWRIEKEHGIDYDFERMPFVHGLAESGSNSEGLADIRAACAHLKNVENCNKVGVMGWCYGGRLACLAATENTFDACIGTYPTFFEKHLDIAGDLKVPLNLHLPELERYGTVEDAIDRIVAAFRDDPMVESFVYPEAEHGFDFSPPHPYAHHRSSRLCDSRVIRFLDRELLQIKAG